MKIIWIKESAGVYQSDPSRFCAVKIDVGYWLLFDGDMTTDQGLRCDSLRECKIEADDVIDGEELRREQEDDYRLDLQSQP